MFISGHFHVLAIRRPHCQCNTNREVATASPHFCNEPHPLHVHFMKVAPGTRLRQILVKATLCCEWKGRAASTQSFTLWHQATIKIPRRANFISACSCHMGVVLHTHPVRGDSHIHHNANWEAATLAAKLG